MRSKGTRSPFILYKKSLADGSSIWYARYWNPEKETYTLTKSTGILVQGVRERKAEAATKARAMLKDISFAPSVPKDLFLDYLSAFWTPESAYAQQHKQDEGKPLSLNYIKLNHADIERHLRPFPPFADITVSQLTRALISDWKLWAAKRGLSARRVNSIIQTMRVPVRYALDREEIDKDPFLKIKEAKVVSREKGILTPAEIAKLITVQDADPRVTFAVLLAFLTGMRRGEIRGLRWGDIDEARGIIHIRNNYIDGEGDKEPKAGSARQVLLPTDTLTALEAVRAACSNHGSENYVLFGLASPDAPCSISTLRKGFIRMLEGIGISVQEQRKRNLTLHGARHTFVTIARASGISDIMVQALAGHKTSEMMDNYSHGGQVIDFIEARKKLEAKKTPEKEAKNAITGVDSL